MPKYRNEEYATTTDFVMELKEGKEKLRRADFPLKDSRSFVRQFLQPERLSHLGEARERNVYLVAPSTSGTNILPALFAEELKKLYGGEVVQNWAHPLSETRTALKIGNLAKMRDPVKAVPGEAVLQRLDRNARLVLVDDVVTTGGTIRALREVLHTRGLRAEQVVSMAQWDLRKVNERDIDRIAEKLNDPTLRPAVVGVLWGQLKQFSNYMERELTDGNANARLEIRNYILSEYDRLRGLGLAYTGPEQGAAVGLGRVESAQRPEIAGAGIPAGIPREDIGVRRGEDRAENSQLGGLIGKLEQLRLDWAKSPPATRAPILKAAEKLVNDLPGSDLTRVALRVSAREFVQGKETPEKLQSRVAAHAKHLDQYAALHRGRSRDLGLGHSR